MSDFATMQEAEIAVINDFIKRLNNNSVNFQNSHSGTLSTVVNGHELLYRVVWVDSLKAYSINYFPNAK